MHSKYDKNPHRITFPLHAISFSPCMYGIYLLISHREWHATKIKIKCSEEKWHGAEMNSLKLVASYKLSIEV